MKNGIYKDLSIEDYHDNKTHHSSTGIRHAKRSLKDFWYFKQGHYDHGFVSHFDFGNACELALLDHGEFVDKVEIFDADKRPEPEKTFGSKLNKEWKQDFYDKAQSENKYVINAKGDQSFETIECILDSCYRDKTIQNVLKNIDYQSSIFWTDKDTGLNLKTRPDVIKSSKNVIVDIKTTNDGSPEKFTKSLTNFDYPIQAAMQIDGVLQGGLMDKVDYYFWLVLEKSPPYSAQLYEFTMEDRVFIEEQYRFLLKRIKRADDLNFYPGYTDRADNELGIIRANIPPYYQVYKV